MWQCQYSCGNTQAVTYFALCIIKKIASSILIPKSSLCDTVNKTQLALQRLGRASGGANWEKKNTILSHCIVTEGIYS